MVMIACPRTGRAISTGMETDRASFRRGPVFFGRTRCAHCEATHQWFARDAWVDEDVSSGAREKTGSDVIRT
jgi:hypothetical protein